jgi:hypothetical protein
MLKKNARLFMNLAYLFILFAIITVFLDVCPVLGISRLVNLGFCAIFTIVGGVLLGLGKVGMQQRQPPLVRSDNTSKVHPMLKKNARLFMNLAYLCMIFIIVTGFILVYLAPGIPTLIGVGFCVIFAVVGGVFLGLGRVGLMKKQPRP